MDTINVEENQESAFVRYKKNRKKRTERYYIFFVVIAAIMLVYAAMATFLCDIKHIEVEGVSEYTENQIIVASEIYEGDNLITLDTLVIENNILSHLLLIENVEVKKVFPNTIRINVEKSNPYLNIQHGMEYMIVSQSRKMLSENPTKQEGLLTISGFDPVKNETGKYIESADSYKEEILETFCKLYDAGKIDEISEIDLTERYDIILRYGNNIEYHIGDSTELEYKLELGKAAMEDLKSDVEYVLKIVGDNQVSVMQKSAVKDINQINAFEDETEEESSETESDEEATDENQTEDTEN